MDTGELATATVANNTILYVCYGYSLNVNDIAGQCPCICQYAKLSLFHSATAMLAKQSYLLANDVATLF